MFLVCFSNTHSCLFDCRLQGGERQFKATLVASTVCMYCYLYMFPGSRFPDRSLKLNREIFPPMREGIQRKDRENSGYENQGPSLSFSSAPHEYLRSSPPLNAQRRGSQKMV